MTDHAHVGAALSSILGTILAYVSDWIFTWGMPDQIYGFPSFIVIFIGLYIGLYILFRIILNFQS